MAWLELFARFQEAISICIAALVGFAGIIITIRANARLAEKERKEQRSREKDALIATLYSEIVTIRDIIDDELMELNKMKDIFLYPLHNEETLLDACVDKLGLLSKEAISEVLKAYLVWREVPKKMTLEFGSMSKIRDDYILVTKERNERCKAILQAARAPVLQALEALDGESTRERSGSQ